MMIMMMTFLSYKYILFKPNLGNLPNSHKMIIVISYMLCVSLNYILVSGTKILGVYIN